jgi:GH18 family chitinase
MMSRTASHGNHDGDTGINYFTYGDSTNPQWISHDNPDSVVEKVKYAKKKGLRGLAL